MTENFDLDYTIIIRGKLFFDNAKEQQDCLQAGHHMHLSPPAFTTRTFSEVELSGSQEAAYMKSQRTTIPNDIKSD